MKCRARSSVKFYVHDQVVCLILGYCSMTNKSKCSVVVTSVNYCDGN